MKLNLLKKCTLAAAALGGFGLYWLFALAAPVLDDQPVGYVGALDMNNYNIASGQSVIYRGDYFRGTWDGDLFAYNVATNGATSVKWQARDQLAAQAWDTGRKIFTSNGSAGIPFSWTTTTTALTASQQTALGGEPQGRYLLNYTRGDATYEDAKYRKRYSKLGDIIHSRPHYFRHSASVERVYVGANDGMLHAFDAATGNEVFAYVPSMLIPKLSQFAANPYQHHKYGVDGLIAISSFQNGGATTTMLVSGMGAGAIGVFALNVTNPSPADETTAASMAKWEIDENSTGFANLGHVYGAPKIVRLSSGTRVVLIPNGINSAQGKASLFLVNPVTGEKIAEILADSTGPDNGLTAITAADSNGDGKADVAYGGDLKGNVWKFNLSGTSYPGSATALFTPSTGTARAIMAAPGVSGHPLGGVMVNFGTGKFLEDADITSTASEYLYGIWDSTKATSTTFAEPTLSVGNTTGTTPTLKYRVSSTANPNYANGARGWRITLGGGERIVGGEPIVDSGRYGIVTSAPNTAVTSTHGSWLLELDTLTGSGPAKPFMDINGDGAIDLVGNTDKVSVTPSVGPSTFTAPAGKFLGTGVWSQPILPNLNTTFDVPYYNRNTNQMSSPLGTTTVATNGVAGGHFDFDIYYNQCNPLAGGEYKDTCDTNIHNHEYDDKYNVTGVNLLNASNSAFNLVNAIASNTTRFKLLIANQKMSPAVTLTLGSTTKAAWEWPVTTGGFVADTAGGTAKSFSRADINRFIIAMPVNAFTSQVWRPGSGDKRAGLTPSKTGCVRANDGAQGTTGTGPWMNGAFTLQVVADNTPATATELNQPSDPEPAAMGYRLRKDTTSQAFQLAQYTMFWHEGVCFGEAGWTSTLAISAESPSTATPPAGTDDPRGTFFNNLGGDIGGGTIGAPKIITVLNGVEVYQVTTYNSATNTYTITTYKKSDNSVVKTETFTQGGGGGDEDGCKVGGELPPGCKQTGKSARFGRLSWQEIVR
jgi:Neisseria PilC beta-propeller domain